MKTKIEIKHWIYGSVLFEYEAEGNTIRETLQRAVASSADLRSANLYSADLRSANLYSADLRSANLYGANLRGANLRGADLRSANLYGADLYGANLYGADLRSANLRGADLRSANLYGANLRGASLRGTDLRGADLYGAKLKDLPEWYVNLASRDMLFIFQSFKGELPFLREKLVNGEINGTQYEGECACLVGTLANADGGIENVCSTIPFYDKGLHNPAEQWFYQIREGDTPKTSAFSKHALKLIDMVLKEDKKKGKSKSK